MKIRINNMGASSLKTKTQAEIVRYYLNGHFGKREKYIKDGYMDKGTCIQRGNVSFDNSCFQREENLYVVAFLEYNKKEQDIDLKSVGPRILELDEENRKDFFEVYKLADKMMMEENDSKE